ADKKFYIVDVFPRQQKELPSNMLEVWHRARDIIFMDKTDKNIEMLKVNERYVDLLRKMYQIINAENVMPDSVIKTRFKEIEPEYNVLVKGRSIKEVCVSREDWKINKRSGTYRKKRNTPLSIRGC
ncbi:MAG TPA: hypothetical protein VE643_08330, partial [Nitrososphaeraceae archaeon]|nr:hypothetical protein [Nitrososphaeraceae archaeon]